MTQAFLDRIAAYDRRGPALWAIVVTNPDALADAEALDRAFAETGQFVGPLHGIPVLVKDNYDVAGTADHRRLARAARLDSARKDATIVPSCARPGPIILAKTTMSEWARGGFDNINSVLPGFARNPYNTAYATGGSSGGTGSGLAASFGVVGLGSDTWGSIRNPSSNNALVGLRPSWALVSRAGMIGLYDARDTAGPMARIRRRSRGAARRHRRRRCCGSGDRGRARQYPADLCGRPSRPTACRANASACCARRFRPMHRMPFVTGLLDKAVEDMRKAGAEIVDPFVVPGVRCISARVPIRERSPRRHRALSRDDGPRISQDRWPTSSPRRNSIRCTRSGLRGDRGRAAAAATTRSCTSWRRTKSACAPPMLAAMAASRHRCFICRWPAIRPSSTATANDADRRHHLDRLRPALAGGNVVPMGYTCEDLPSGLQIVGRPWSETTLLEIAYGYEQATHHRHPPTTVPPLA